MRYTMEIILNNKKEYMLFNSLWAARLRAKDFAKYPEVKKVVIIDNEKLKIVE